MKCFVAVLALCVLALAGTASACGPGVVVGASFGTGYGVSRSFGGYGASYNTGYYQNYQATAYVPVATVLVNPYVPTVAAQVVPYAVQQQAVVQQQVVAPQQAVVQQAPCASAAVAAPYAAVAIVQPQYAVNSYAALYSTPFLTAFAFSPIYGHNYHHHVTTTPVTAAARLRAALRR